MIKAFSRIYSQLQQVSSATYAPKRIEQLGLIEAFTFEECKKEIEQVARSQSLMFLSGIKVSTEELESLHRVVNCLKDDELKNTTIPFDARKEICKVLGCGLWEVTKLVILFKSHLKMHQFLQARVKRNEALPKSYEEIKGMMMNDPLPRTKFIRFSERTTRKYSKKQRKYRMHQPKF